MKFKCTMCGECCRHIAGIPELAAYDRGDGVCSHLAGNKCDIYATRPYICDVSAVYERHFKGKISEDEFLRITYDACERLKALRG